MYKHIYSFLRWILYANTFVEQASNTLKCKTLCLSLFISERLKHKKTKCLGHNYTMASCWYRQKKKKKFSLFQGMVVCTANSCSPTWQRQDLAIMLGHAVYSQQSSPALPSLGSFFSRCFWICWPCPSKTPRKQITFFQAKRFVTRFCTYW